MDPYADIRFIVDAMDNATATLDDGKTLLHLSADHEQPEFTAMLIKHGAVVDARMVNGETPLHWAIRRDAVETAKVLLAHGADASATNVDGFSCLDLATGSSMDMLMVIREHIGASSD